jgi:hypothetical protein
MGPGSLARLTSCPASSYACRSSGRACLACRDAIGSFPGRCASSWPRPRSAQSSDDNSRERGEGKRKEGKGEENSSAGASIFARGHNPLRRPHNPRFEIPNRARAVDVGMEGAHVTPPNARTSSLSYAARVGGQPGSTRTGRVQGSGPAATPPLLLLGSAQKPRGFKIRCPCGREGSSPSFGTILLGKVFMVAFRMFRLMVWFPFAHVQNRYS